MDRQAEVLKSLLARTTSKEAEGGFDGEFSRLKMLSTKYRTEKVFSTKAAEKKENVKKNRYKDIMPFDHTRVKLSVITSDTDYINASFIKGALQQKAYIATQGPLPHTVQDFWRMIWEYNVEIIVMACREFEMGRKKCERYWPEKREEPFVCDPFTIHYESMESKGDYLTRILKVTYCNTSRSLWQLHYVNWPDHGVPASIPPILELLQEMRSYQEHDDVPICIHCSAGCGRTGVLCVIDYTWKLLQKQLITEDFCIFKLVQEMRTQRPSIVQTKEQYQLVYRTMKILFENYLQMMANHSSAVEVPASPTPSPVSSESDLTDPCEVLDLDQEEEVHTVPLPRRIKSEEPKELTNWETAGGLPPALLRLPAEEDSCNGVVSQSSTCLPEDTLSSQEESSRQSAQGEWDSQSERHSSQHAKTVGSAEPIPKSWAMAPPTQEDTPAPSPSGGSWNAPREEEVALLELEINPESPGCWQSSSFLVEDPYFSPSSPQDPQAAVNPFDSTTSNPGLTTPTLTLNDHPLQLPQFETVATVSDEDIPPTPPERTPESYILAISPGSPATPVSDEDNPPSLPERTPESYVLANSPGSPERASCSGREGLLTVLTLNATETIGGIGSPPSPVPSLPERTPESFILATDDDLLQGVAQHTPLSPNARVGMSSEWCGTLEPPSPEPKKSWKRSKSLKVRMSMLVYPSFSLAPAPVHPQPTAPQLPPTAKIGPGNQNSVPVPQPSREPSQRIGSSSEWAGNSQPKTSLDVVMIRSKSVRAKSSQNDRLSVACPAAATSLTVGPAGNAELFMDSGTSASAGGAGERQNISSGASALPSMTRSKSLKMKFLKNIRKPKGDPPAPPAPSNPVHSRSTSPGFTFGFGNRFRKPKGPRHQPETWV